MPWVQATKPPGETPSHYKCPLVVSDDTLRGRNIEYAKSERKTSGQLREEILGYQKICGQQKDFDTARYFREMASDIQKEYRGWEAAIKIIEGDNDFWHHHVSEPIAPYADRAFGFMDLYQPGVEK